jgi:hypothetical protein
MKIFPKLSDDITRVLKYGAGELGLTQRQLRELRKWRYDAAIALFEYAKKKQIHIEKEKKICAHENKWFRTLKNGNSKCMLCGFVRES